MKKLYIFFPVGCLLVLSLLGGCNLINPGEPVPSYIHIEKISLTTDYPSEGSNSSKISDAWVYIDGQLQGAYELPVTFPVLKQGTHEVIVKAGIKINSIAATRAPYPFYQQYSQQVTMTPGQIVTMSPVVTYASGVAFSWKEDFNTGSGTLIAKPGGSDTTVQSLMLSMPGVDPDDVFEGAGSVAGYLDADRTFCEFICNPSIEIPGGSADVFLEFNYKCNASFAVGLYSHATGSSYQTSILNLRPSATWNKAYVYLTPTIQTYPGLDYTVFFGMDNAIGRDSVAFLLDNVKVVHY